MATDPATESPGAERGAAAPTAGRHRLVLAASMVAIAGLAALGGYVYSRMTQDAAGVPEIPLVQADPSPTKKRPAEPGGMSIPNQDKLVYGTVSEGEAKEKIERLLPPPEEPLPPPQPPAEVAATPIPPQPVPAPKPAAIPTPPPSPSSDVAAIVPPVQPPPPPAPQPAPQPAPSPVSAKYMVQLAAFRSAANAKGAWARLVKANRDLLGRLAPAVQRVDLGAGKGVFYRLRAGPFQDKAAAKKLCSRLKARKLDCLVIKP